MLLDQDITIIIPAKREKESLGLVLSELKNYNYKILIVMEKEDKETYEVTKNFLCSVIFQLNGKGYGNAIIQGLKEVKTNYVCTLYADGSCNPKEIINMKNKLINNFDFVFGSRYLDSSSGSDDDNLLTFIGNKFFTFLGNLFFKLSISDLLYTFVLGKTENFKKLNLINNDFRICVEIPVMAIINNNKITDISSYERKRFHGKKKVNEFKDGFLILFYMIILLFKIKKLRF
jgi:glycosyltransferase involved in cell wall biosynthesis